MSEQASCFWHHLGQPIHFKDEANQGSEITPHQLWPQALFLSFPLLPLHASSLPVCTPPTKEMLRSCLVIYKTVYPFPHLSPVPAFLPCHPTLVLAPRIHLLLNSLMSVSYKERERLCRIPFLLGGFCSPGLRSKPRVKESVAEGSSPL